MISDATDENYTAIEEGAQTMVDLIVECGKYAKIMTGAEEIANALAILGVIPSKLNENDILSSNRNATFEKTSEIFDRLHTSLLSRFTEINAYCLAQGFVKAGKESIYVSKEISSLAEW